MKTVLSNRIKYKLIERGMKTTLKVIIIIGLVLIVGLLIFDHFDGAQVIPMNVEEAEDYNALVREFSPQKDFFIYNSDSLNVNEIYICNHVYRTQFRFSKDVKKDLFMVCVKIDKSIRGNFYLNIIEGNLKLDLIFENGILKINGIHSVGDFDNVLFTDLDKDLFNKIQNSDSLKLRLSDTKNNYSEEIYLN